jgi:class 3 adenylate cyclase
MRLAGGWRRKLAGPDGRAKTLVELFIEIRNWPASRKTTVLTACLLPLQLILWLVARLSASSVTMVDVGLVDRLCAGGVATLLIGFLVSLPSTLARRQEVWTSYFFVGLYYANLLYIVHAFGSASTVLAALVPTSILVIALYYGERLAWHSVVYVVILSVLTNHLESLGVLPYAPVLVDRTIDAQRNGVWSVINYFPVLVFLIVGLGLTTLILAARRLQEARLEEAQKLIRRYVPSQLADKIVSGRHAEETAPERTKLTMFFSDVEGFTNASDELDAEELAALLNEYLSEMSSIAERYGATINQFVGDGIMIFFGAPTATNDKDHALRAVRMSLDMQKRMSELQPVWFGRGFQRPFRIRIGINTGYASIGDFGSRGRMVYTAIGIQVNLAARIQAQCVPGKVLVSHTTWALVHEEIPCTSQGEIQVKGIHYPVKVYEVSDAPITA